MNLWNIISLILLIIGGCARSQNSSEEQIFIEALDEIIKKGSELKDGVYIIIPNVGCESCINSAEEFLLNNLGNNDITFILTKFTSIKQIKIHLGERVIKSSNVILDRNSIVYKKGLESIYPAFIYVIRSKIEKVEYLNPENDDALYNLNTYLSTVHRNVNN